MEFDDGLLFFYGGVLLLIVLHAKYIGLMPNFNTVLNMYQALCRYTQTPFDLHCNVFKVL